MLDDHAAPQTTPPAAGPRLSARVLLILAAVLLAVGLTAGIVVWRAVSPHYYSTNAMVAAVALPHPGCTCLALIRYSDAVGSVRVTTNGGATWRRQTLGALTPQGLAFGDATHGWIVGDSSKNGGDSSVLATTDGGATWTKQPLHTTLFLQEVTCVGAGRCWVVGGNVHDRGTVVATTDGGAHWKVQLRTGREQLVAVTFADADTGWAFGESGDVFATSDGGARWSKKKMPSVAGISGAACFGARHVWCIGVGARKNVIVASTDAGATWKQTYIGDDGLTAISFSDERHGWVVGDDGLILATTDGGATWTKQRSGTDADLRCVAFADATHGLAAGSRWSGGDPEAGLVGTVLLRTADGGGTWAQVH